MDRVEPLRLTFRQLTLPYGTNLESLDLDPVKNPAGEPALHRVRLDDGQRPFGHPAIISGEISAAEKARPTSRRTNVTSTGLPPHADPDIHKGAIEGDRPADEQQGNPNGDGVD